ncbi:DinB family protein [Aquimarina sp. AD1]|uniref:DinB family protein n=1 Tax=Aquimarina sp. (strain AD1) TaxID=1714848 RepID=UPI000EAAC5F3|nr:DinB family protein [Aquimarina sp. AD1]RKN27030.1 DinB family protein [Aquimarina sp. AD1]
MNHQLIIKSLLRNQKVFEELLSGITKEEYLWKDRPNRWCLLEIVCQLYDEEKEDFRKRTKHILDTPDKNFEPIDPEGWVVNRAYIKQDYNVVFNNFIEERKASINWLNSLENTNWNNVSIHPDLGEMTAKQFLSNWLAHDYLHFKQIAKLKLDYIKYLSKEDFSYAEGD